MSALISGVTALARAMAPDHQDQWTDANVQSAIHLADLAICEEVGVVWATHEIPLIDGAIYYALPDDIVKVRAVEYAVDGSTFDEVLKCVTLPEMDDIDMNWQDAAGTPSLFSLLSVPGTDSYSKIMVWKPILSVASQAVRINYLGCRAAEADLSGVDTPDEIQQSLYLPYVMSLMKQGEDPMEAAGYMVEYRKNVSKAKSKYGHKTAERRYQ